MKSPLWLYRTQPPQFRPYQVFATAAQLPYFERATLNDRCTGRCDGRGITCTVDAVVRSMHWLMRSTRWYIQRSMCNRFDNRCYQFDSPWVRRRVLWYCFAINAAVEATIDASDAINVSFVCKDWSTVNAPCANDGECNRRDCRCVDNATADATVRLTGQLTVRNWCDN